MTTPAIGELAPDFTLPDQHGVPTTLSHMRGSLVALVFFPFAFSGTCTGELRQIRDGLEDFQHDGIQVLTISCDAIYALRAWADAEGYFFPLLSDFWPHGEVSQEYGVFLAGTLLAIIPPAILFFALQKEFVSGLTSGAVKG